VEEWSIRASYNEMRDDELAAGFLYYLPMIGRDIANRVSQDSYEIFVQGRDTHIEVAGRGIFLSREKQLHDEREKNIRKVPPGKTFRQWVIDTLAGETMARMLANPWQHLKVSLLMAWRGVFRRCDFIGLGFYWAPSTSRLAESWGFVDWPRWGWSLSSSTVAYSVVCITMFLTLIVVPLWFWFSQRRFETVLIVLPALYSHGMYAVASSFTPRYAVPEIPLQVVTTMLLVFLLGTALHLPGGQRRLLKSRPPLVYCRTRLYRQRPALAQSEAT
ncbi:MAG: hypothetical protein OXQ29_01295, partial [Rhodospirillaceae bacterium]|nr:hypothetical protein [Rhodospirillaceae bacterium]